MSRAVDLSCCVASMTTGLLAGDVPELRARERLQCLAATLPELYGTVDRGCLDRIAERTGAAASGEGIGEVLLISDEHAHLIQPLATKPGAALLGVSSGVGSLGLVLSEFHARVSALEGP